jgi:hypothetical protein
MFTPEVIVRWAIAYVVIALAGAAVALIVGIWFPSATVPIFVGFSIIQVPSTIVAYRRWRDEETDSTTIRPQNSSEKSKISMDFRFIGPNTTLEEVIARVGPYDRIRDAIDGRNVQWDVPYGTVCLFLDGPVVESSPVGRIRYVKDRSE